MGVKERYESRKKTIKEKDENKSNIGVAERYEMNKFSASLPSRLKNLTSTRDALYKDYTSRFTDKDGNYINAYRGDTEDALTSFKTSKANIDNESKAILDGLSKYGKYLDADKVKGIQDYLSSYSGDLDGMYKTYQSDYDYYSQFADEDSYNRAMTYAKEQEEKKTKYSAMSDDELNAEIERLKGSKKGNVLSNFAMRVVGAQDSNMNLYAEAESNQEYNDSVNYDISLIEKEKTNRKYKQIDKLPEDVRSLIDELTVIDSGNDDDEFVNDANVLISGLTGGNNVNYNADSDYKRFGEIVQTLESKGIENWQELLEYNKLRYNEKKNAPIKEEDAEMAKEHPVLSSLATIPASLGKGMGVIEMLENVGSEAPLDPNSPYFSMNNFVNTTRETVMDEHDLHLNTGNETLDNIDLFDELYGTAMSMGDSVTAGVGLGGIGGVALGLSAASDSAQEVAENGGSSTEAIVTGLVSGVNEMLWESLSLGRLNDLITNGVSKRGFKAFVGELFKSMGINASEEFNTEAANLLADYLINGGASTYSETVQNYLAMGYADNEAKAQARKDMLVQMTKAGVGGALQGLFMGIGGGAISSSLNAIESKAYENKYYNQQGQNIIDQGNLSQLVEETEALGNERALKSLKDLANQVSGVKTEELDAKGSKKYAHQVGKLYKGVQKAQFKSLSKSSETAFKNVIKAELEKTDADNVDAIADILVKAAHNEGLTRAESKLLQSVNGHEILNKAYSSAEFVEALNAEEKKQYEESRDTILDTVDLTHDKGKAKILSETEYDISSDGKTTVEATGEEVDIVSIDSLDGDDISLSVKSGDSKQVILAGELRLNEDYAVILEGLKDIKADFGLDVASANSILALWDGYNGDVVDFSKAMKSGIMYGQYNMRKDFDNSRMGRNVPDNIRNRMFEIGGEYKQRVVDEQEADVKANGNANAKNGEFSITYAEGVTYENLNKSQKAQVDFAQVIAQTFGFNLEIFRSPKNTLGQSVGENGSYNRGTNTMRLDIDAGTLDGKSLILFTQSHELTHFIKKWSPKAFKTFADLLVEKYGSKGVSVDKLVNDKITQSIINRGKDHALSYDEAFEEVVCDACEDFLADPDIQQTIVEFAKVDKNLAQKIKDFLKGLIAKLEKAIEGLQGQSAEAKALRELDVEDLNELKNLWTAALFDSRENVLQARESKVQKNITDEGDVKQSVREIISASGKSYGIGVYLDSNLLTGLTEDERKQMIKEFVVSELAGQPFIAYDTNNDAVGIGIAKKNDKIRNSKGKKKEILKELYHKNNDIIVKQEAIVLIDELIANAKYDSSQKPDYSHDWLDNYGQNDWDYWKVFIQEKNKTVWEATLNIANTSNGEKILYDIKPIKMVEEGIKSPSTATEGIIQQDDGKSQEKFSNRNFLERTYDSLSSAKNENGDELFQYRAIQHDVPEYRALLEKYSDMSSAQIDALFETMNKAFAIIEENLEILDYAWDENLNEDGTWDDTVDARAFNPVKPNSDKLYKYSLDFSTMCRKRLLQQVIAEELSLALDRAVTKAEGIAIRNELIKLQEEGRQIEIACALCYVESARMKSPEQIQKFLNDAGQMVREFFATKAKSSIAEAEEKARKSVAKKYAKEIKEGSISPTDTYTTKGGKVKYIPLSKLPKKMKDEIHKAKREAKSSYSPSAEEQRIIDIASNLPVTAFTTAEGLKNLAKDNPVIFDAYTSFVRNATHSKGTEKDVWYRVGDANKIGDDLIAAMNKENGLRSQSWSDFQVIHLLDYVGAIIELSTKKAKMQAYTKVPDYVNLMGLTGQMINLSLIPARDFNGKLEFDSVEGMAFKVARELRDKYPDTAGTISIGITNEQIQMLLDSMDIDYVIPYHHSAMSKVVRKAMHIPSWVTYQDYQNEKNITSKKDALANAKKYGVQLLKESDERYHKAPSFSEWFDLEEARQVAQLENLNPTDLKAQKKYGVMYGAYKAMQQAADNYLRICAERGLVPKFCHEKADFTVEDNYWKLLIDRKMINQKTGEIIEQKPVQPIFNEGEVLNILNNEIARYEDVKKDFDYATRIVTERFLNGDMNEHISEIAKSIGDTVTNVTKVAILNSDIKNQDRDSTGRELTPEQAEFFEDSKVRDADGNLLVVYHGTNTDFTVFDKSKLSGNTKAITANLGFFFTNNIKQAKRFTKEPQTKITMNPYANARIMTNYLNITNPKVFESGEADSFEILRDEIVDYAIKYTQNWYLKVTDGKSLREMPPKVINEIVRGYVWNLKRKGYDGIFVVDTQMDKTKAEETNTMYIVFESNQTKSVDNLSPTENDDIRYQDRRNAEQAEDYFGTTDNYDVAGYITVNGNAIDFSGNKFGAKSKTRTIDHREIGDAFESDEYGKEWGYAGSMLKFMNEGNIRVTPETAGMELMSAPNSKQIPTLKDYIRHFDGKVIVDLDTFKGVDTSDPYNITVDMPVKSVEYSRKTSADKIVSDIINYFETGVVPSSPSSIRDFLYQDRPISDREVLVDAMSNIEDLSIEDQNRLEIYRGKIDNINELEKELADVGKQIHKIITTKGSDRKQMAELNAKADALRKQISRVDGELLRIEAMKPIQNLVEIRKKQVLKAHKQKVQEQRHKNVEGRHKTATKNKIKRVIKTLESLYSNPTKEKNVKIEFQDMVKKALIMADALFDDGNISSSDILSGDITIRLGENEKKKLDEWRKVYKTRQDYRDKLDALESSGKVNQKTHDGLLDMINKCNNKLNRLGRDLSDVVERQKAELNEESLKNAIGSLVKAYKSLKDSPEGYAQAAYNDFVAKRLEALEESLAKATVKSMTLTQLDELYQAYKMVLTTVRTANDIFVKNKRMSVADMGEAVIREVEKVAKPTENKIAALRGIREFSWEELKPVYAFERIGSETFMQLYKEVLRGQGIVAQDIAEAQAFFDKMNKTYGYDSWDLKETKDFKLADGRIFTINLQEIMSIYAYSRRDQALDHITSGGFVFDNKEFFTDTKEKGLKGKIKKQRTTVKAYRINDEMFYKIINSLTKEQKKFAEEMQDYLTSMGEKGNEVSRVLYGIDIFNEKHYFPLMSSKAFIQQTNEPVGTVTLKNSGMTKATVPHAKNPIVLQGFMDVWANHINKMSTYHGLVLPIENLNKVFNYTGYAHEDESVSVETILSGAYGDEVNKYIENFITDLNGGIKTQSSGNWVTKGVSLFKKTAVAASTSVVIQQPTAIVRAMAMINPKYFVHGKDGLKHNEAWEKIKKYAPIAIVKEMGGFDVGSGRQVADYITAKEYKGKDKVKGFFTDSTYRDDALMWGATKADEFGWITIWNAVEKEIADTTTYKVDSEEFLNACGERFTEVIDYTQVYDSVLSRSGFMRNKGEISKMATSFMGEPTTSFNMLYNAILQAKRGNIGKGEMTKIMGATISSIILASIAKSLIYALRDDDEDESYAEKYAQSLTNSLMEDLFIPNMLPYVSDITSLFSGWEVERTDMAILKDFRDAIEDLDSSNKSLWRKIEDLGGAVAAFGGIPAKNVMRTVREMYNLIANVLDDNTSSASDVGDAIVETVTGETSSSDINEALEKGNTAKAKKIINDLVADKVKQGKTEKEAKASVKASVTSYWKELYLQAYRDKDNAEMLRIRQILQPTGLYDNVVETCSNWIKSMKDETTNTTYKKW